MGKTCKPVFPILRSVCTTFVNDNASLPHLAWDKCHAQGTATCTRVARCRPSILINRILMDKNILKIIVPATVAAAMALAGCDNPEYPDPAGEQGTLSLSGFSITAVDETSGTPETIDVSDFVVNVRDAATGDIAASWTYVDMPDEVSLYDGNYIVEAYNAEAQPAAWEAPYYYASAQVRIYGHEVTAVSPLQCSLSNVAVSVSYSDAFKAAMGSDVRVTVEMIQGVSLEFLPGETRKAYFMPAASTGNTIQATLTGTVGGVETRNVQVLTKCRGRPILRHSVFMR